MNGGLSHLGEAHEAIPKQVETGATPFSGNGTCVAIGMGGPEFPLDCGAHTRAVPALSTGTRTAHGSLAALASEALLPFRDGVDAAAEAGVRAIIQPGGSVRDKEVIQAADEHGLAMIFTGRRLFRH